MVAAENHSEDNIDQGTSLNDSVMLLHLRTHAPRTHSRCCTAGARMSPEADRQRARRRETAASEREIASSVVGENVTRSTGRSGWREETLG